MIKISACILTHNSEKTLEKLLQSLNFVDEIIITDDESTDSTIVIAKKYHAKIFKRKLDGFGAQRNYCADHASNNWVLSLDSDEVITSALKEEIKNISGGFDGYQFPRLTYFAGRPIRHGGWYPDYNIRLYDKTKMNFKNAVHEKVVGSSKIGTVKNPLHHYSYSGIGDYLARLKKYTQMQVDNSNVPKNHLNLILLVLKPIYRFFKMYFVELGFLDGWRGLFLAKMSGFYDGRVHFLAEKEALKKSSPAILAIAFVALAVFQGYLAGKFGLLSLAIPLGIAILCLALFNLKTSIFILLFSIITGQAVRLYLSSGGGIVISDIVVPLFLIGWLCYKFLKSPRFVKSPIDFNLATVLLVFVITFLINIGHFFSLLSVSYLFRLFMYLALFWPLYDLLKDQERLKSTQKFLDYLFYGLIGLGVLQLIFVPYLLFLMPYGWDPHLNRMVSTFLDPNFLAAFLNIGFALALAKFYSLKKPVALKIWPLIIFAAAIIATYSRSGYLMMGVILFIFALVRDRKLILYGAIAVIIIILAVPRFEERIIGGLNVDASATLRFGSWRDGFRLIDNNIWAGVGYNNIEAAKLQAGIITAKETASHSASGVDSSLMVVWATSGVFGLIFFLYWYAKNIYYGARAYLRKKDPYTKNLGLGIFAIFLGLLLDSIFVNTLLYSHILILLAVVLAIFYNYYEQNA